MPLNKFDELVHADGYALSKKFDEVVLVPPLQSQGLCGIICHAEPDGRCAYHLGDMMKHLLDFDSSNGERLDARTEYYLVILCITCASHGFSP